MIVPEKANVSITDLLNRCERVMEMFQDPVERLFPHDYGLSFWGPFFSMIVPEAINDRGPDRNPTKFLPGSEEKIEVMSKRLFKRQPLFHRMEPSIMDIDTRELLKSCKEQTMFEEDDS